MRLKFYLPVLISAMFVCPLTTAWSQSSRLNDKTAMPTPMTTDEENVEAQEFLFLPQPCNHGCEGGEFEIGSLDYGYVVRHVCNWAPNLGQLDPPVMNRVCFRTNNNTGDTYWWSVNQLEALTSCSGLGSTGVPCVSYINFKSTPDLITTTTVPIADIDWSTDAVGNPDFTWDPLNQENNHFVRLVHQDGIKINGSTSAGCPIKYTEFNDMSESLKFSRTYATNEVGDNHPALTANTQYVMEFYTSCSGRLEEIDGSLLPLPLNNQFKLRYFVGPTSTTCTDTYIEYENPTGNCQFNTGRFTSGLNCSPNLEHNYGNSQEVWEHVSMTFTAAVTSSYAVFFSPLTDDYIQPNQFQQALYFIDDVFITPISENPISANLSIQGNTGPVVTWNGFYQIPLSVFVQTDWEGSNTQPVTVQLNLPPGITIATPGWTGNARTFATGTLNNGGITLTVMLNINNAFNPNNENEISLTTGANTVSGCLNHVPRIAVELTCIAPTVNFASYEYCTTPSIVATVAPVTGLTPSYSGTWDGPGTFTANGLTAYNPLSGAYVLTLSNGACSQNYTTNYTAPAAGSYTVWNGNTMINNQTSFDLQNQVIVAQGDVFVEPTYTWDLDNTVMYFQPEKRIQIKAKGHVKGYKTTFTAACPALWKGFEVIGDPTVQETWLTNLTLSPHGTCELNTCHVKRAYYGIFANKYNTNGNGMDTQYPTGGIVKIYGESTFINNRGDLFFGKTGTIGGGNRVSRISATTFKIDQSYVGPQPVARINLVANAGVRMANIDVINLDPGRLLTEMSFTGINLSDAKCELICDVNNPLSSTGSDNLIKGFTYGIRASRTASYGSQGQVQRVYNTKFECHRGSYSQGIVGLTSHFVGNEFEFLPGGYTTTPNLNGTNFSTSYFGAQVVGRYGAYFNGAHNTITFQQNAIIGTYPQDNINAVGLVVNGTGAQTNDYKLNTFRNLSHGISFYGVNRNTIDGTLGAKFSCNNFVINGKDVILSAPNGSANPGAITGLGISSVQGSSSQSAGNKFSQNPLFSNDDLEQNYNVIQGHTYYYKNAGTQENLALLESNFTDLESTSPHPCQVTSSLTIPTTILSYNNLVSQYQSIKDGGSTPSTVQEIKDAAVSGVLDLYYSLMAKSPNLSEESIVELVLKEYELSNNLLTLILANNPAAAKSEEIKDQLENKLIPLEEWQMQLILAAEHWNSDLDNLQAEMSDALSIYYQLQAEQEDVIRYTIEDPTVAYDELLVLYDPTFCALDWLHIAAIHEQFGNSTERVLALKQFEQSSLCDAPTHNDIETLLDLEMRLREWKPTAPESDPNLLTDLQSTITDTALPWSSAMAFAGIELMTGEKSLEPLFHVGETRAQQLVKPRPNDININRALLLASPNPTNDFVTLTIPDGFEQLGLRLQIFNALGALVHEIVLAQSLMLIDCSQWANGLYTMRAPVNEQLVLTGKLVKQ